MIYHLVKSEKFIDSFIESVDKYSRDPEQNRFIDRTGKSEYQLQSADRLLRAPYGSRRLRELVAGMTSSDQLVIHFMDLESAEWLGKTNTAASVRWIFWGAEFFKLAPTLDPGFKLLDPRSKMLYDSMKFEGLAKDNFIYRYAYNKYLRFRLERLLRAFNAIVPKVDTIYNFNRFDIDYLNQCFGSNIAFELFSYTNLSHFLSNHNDDNASPSPLNDHTNVLLGNSATLTNNHLDMFDLIEPREDLHLWCPLSYGKSRYGSYVAREGKQRYGENFHAIVDYMPYSDYFKLLGGMDHAVMGHNRSQAAGNMLIMFLMGKVVHMKERTGLYKYFEDMGLSTKPIMDKALHMIKLTDDQIALNRTQNSPRIREIFTGNNVANIYRKLF